MKREMIETSLYSLECARQTRLACSSRVTLLHNCALCLIRVCVTLHRRILANYVPAATLHAEYDMYIQYEMT